MAKAAPKPRTTKRAPASAGRGGSALRFLRRLVVGLLMALIAGPPVMVAVYRFVPPPLTILMIERLAQGQGLDHRWVPISRISPAMTRAVVASEDARFCQHHGFDFHAIQKAVAHNEARPGKIRGGSTVSQQTAKNVFLWPDRSWVRKGLEAYFTVLIELVWGKQRIMEVYLNTVEMGPGVYGVEAASQHYFHHGAQSLSPAEASRLAAILPNPLKWNAGDPGPYVRRRTGRIDARSGAVGRDGLAACVLE
ncbi:MAG TPA: monofunctional biosynthetic peptidoglycan transglycosylase [Caulobacteraceae bacterium]